MLAIRPAQAGHLPTQRTTKRPKAHHTTRTETGIAGTPINLRTGYPIFHRPTHRFPFGAYSYICTYCSHEHIMFSLFNVSHLILTHYGQVQLP